MLLLLLVFELRVQVAVVYHQRLSVSDLASELDDIRHVLGHSVLLLLLGLHFLVHLHLLTKLKAFLGLSHRVQLGLPLYIPDGLVHDLGLFQVALLFTLRLSEVREDGAVHLLEESAGGRILGQGDGCLHFLVLLQGLLLLYVARFARHGAG